jgi:hypothetical protein
MADVVAADVPQGTEVKWYGGGAVAQVDLTGMTGTAAVLGGTYLAEFGSLWVTVNDVQVSVIERKASADATETTGADAFTLPASVGATDVVVAYFVDIQTVTLRHVATCKDVSASTSASSSKEAVHGQTTKLTTVGVAESTASMEQLTYTLDFVGMLFGDTLASSPVSGWSKWSNKTHAFKKIGALVGKRRNSSGVVIDKFFLYGAQANSYDQTFPTEEMYTESFNFDVDFLIRARKA